MRHAFLIIAHNEFAVLRRLINMLDHPDVDIYIHFDKKINLIPDIPVKESRLFVLNKRIDVKWGSVSQIQTELLLFETALKNAPYAFYHIISGTHLPLYSLNELLDFYNAHSGHEIMRFWEENPGDADFKLRRIHFPLMWFKDKSRIKRTLCQRTWTVVLRIQRMLHIRINKKDSFYKTDNWLSITEKACRYLVKHQSDILKKYYWSFCGDEYFVASELKTADESFVLCDIPNLLYVDFIKDSPRTLHYDEYNSLKQSGYIWARKFSSK